MKKSDPKLSEGETAKCMKCGHNEPGNILNDPAGEQGVRCTKLLPNNTCCGCKCEFPPPATRTFYVVSDTWMGRAMHVCSSREEAERNQYLETLREHDYNEESDQSEVKPEQFRAWEAASFPLDLEFSAAFDWIGQQPSPCLCKMNEEGLRLMILCPVHDSTTTPRDSQEAPELLPCPPFHVSKQQYPHEIKAAILDANQEAFLWTDHRLIDGICEYLNNRVSAVDEAVAKAWDEAIHIAAQVCVIKADSLRLGAEDGIAPCYAEDVELCETLKQRLIVALGAARAKALRKQVT